MMKTRGYILLELIIALTVFSLAVMGLARALNNSLAVANILNRDYAVRLAMRSFLEEVRRKPLADMDATIQDPKLDLTLTSSVAPLDLRSKEGRAVEDMYTLTVTANYVAGGKAHDESIFVWVHISDDENDRRKRQ
jgi:type II secretory pathway pseudopilin PulG